MGSRVYVGRLSYRAHERDIERFFRGYGRITEILLKNGYAFVEFSDRRDAEDAVHDLNGLCFLRISKRILDYITSGVIVQNAKSRPRGRDMYRERIRERSRSRDRRRSRSRDRKRSHSRDRKKRRHSSSESESPEDNRHRSSSRSQSRSPKKGSKKSGSDRKRKRDRSSSSRSPSPDARKSKDKRKERKYRSSSEKEECAGTNTCSIIVRGFDNKGKFEKFIQAYPNLAYIHCPWRDVGIHPVKRRAIVLSRDSLCSDNFRSYIAQPCIMIRNHSFGLLSTAKAREMYYHKIARLKHLAKKYGDLTDFEMRDDNTWYV
ncbi:hypothetical protein X798_02898 [Onchocerca flexuosa]|uniref:RRM domain-containing protein n=1 Tax=Onchocerca flexuosa TaxID=387005 RepID=A0A238BZA7_9BILA|nr:hypothetical protein X798_02898 [Onchocerca flexuosa]